MLYFPLKLPKSLVRIFYSSGRSCSFLHLNLDISAPTSTIPLAKVSMFEVVDVKIGRTDQSQKNMAAI
jgi:hypothetical protein